MGMSNTAQSFQRLVDSVVAGIPGVFAYLDDLIVFSKTHEEHLKVLEVLFGKLEKAGLTLALTKCIFGVAEITICGSKSIQLVWLRFLRRLMHCKSSHLQLNKRSYWLS